MIIKRQIQICTVMLTFPNYFCFHFLAFYLGYKATSLPTFEWRPRKYQNGLCSLCHTKTVFAPDFAWIQSCIVCRYRHCILARSCQTLAAFGTNARQSFWTGQWKWRCFVSWYLSRCSYLIIPLKNLTFNVWKKN